MLHAIDHIILPARDLDAAAAPFERLGLTVSPRAGHGSAGTANRAIFAGDAPNHVYIEILTAEDPVAAKAAGDREYLLAALKNAPAVARVMFEADIPAPGAAGQPYEAHRDDGSKICDAQALDAATGFGAAVIQYTASRQERFDGRKGRGLFDSEFKLKRLDHLAAMAPELEATTKFWTDTLGVPVFGEVANDVMVIRQMKVGDAILELLGPASPDSPLASRPAGLASMAAFEVDDLDAAIQHARDRGFELDDGREGVLPGTRVSSIPGDQLSGLTLQLLEYV